MNFLAHLYLSGDDPKIMVGNFMGDFVKGRHLADHFEPAIVRGIELHRGIDEFTDTHEVVTESKKRLRATYRHYAPVIVDMFYDHYLAKNWGNYSDRSLPDFADQAYKTLAGFSSILPEKAKGMLPYMIEGNWLVNYARFEGIQQALSGMSRRTKFVSRMEESVSNLRENYDDFKQEFEEFFPQLKAFCDGFLAS